MCPGSTVVRREWFVPAPKRRENQIATYGVLFYVGHQLVHLVGDYEDNDDERLMR